MSTLGQRQLAVWLNGESVGTLEEAGGIWQFRYSEPWALNRIDLSPALSRDKKIIQDGGSERPVQWYFDNLLPEEDARTLLASSAKIDATDSFSLLAAYGAESAGALTLLPPGPYKESGGLNPLSNEALSARIQGLPGTPLTHAAPKRMSLAGAQHKLAVVMEHGELFEPEGSTASSHILKPDHRDIDRYPHTVANEWFVMNLANKIRLPVPPVELLRVPEPVYLIKRFDRVVRKDHYRLRLATLDSCQLLSCGPSYKYRLATVDSLIRMTELCRRSAATRHLLFRWLVFNLLVGNGDSHLKNLTFFANHEGFNLAPHYDLLSTTVYTESGKWGAAELTWPMGSATRFGEVTAAHVLEFGESFGVPQQVGHRLLASLVERVPTAAKALLENIPADMPLGETRLIRQIVFGVITDMIKQLR